MHLLGPTFWNWRSSSVLFSRRSKLTMFSALLYGLAANAEVSTVTLEFENAVLNLDTGIVQTDLDPLDPSNAAIKIAYNSQRSTGGVVFLVNTQAAQLAFMSDIGFDGISLDSIGGILFSEEPVDLPFTASDTVVIKTDTNTFYKLGNASESGDGVTFNYAEL